MAALTTVALGTGSVRIPCWFSGFTGLDCPFCGGSRALGALLDADPSAALGYNAFAVAVVVPVVVVVLVALGRWETGRAAAWWPTGRRGRLLAASLGVLTVGWWVVRNIPAVGVPAV
ncbi:DUF2752 domain-containing protein [Saccharomonospora halophila]|uniref:DUF2752 domain-containing protein n=1 Tax=Saccharomonospora halophila TaxID=129922 RepID=UPI0003757FD1|nr:DUF2752 domain-containing protein [Saccharomonospora halophila]